MTVERVGPLQPGFYVIESDDPLTAVEGDALVARLREQAPPGFHFMLLAGAHLVRTVTVPLPPPAEDDPTTDHEPTTEE